MNAIISAFAVPGLLEQVGRAISGTLDATSTVYCRNHPGDAALDYIEGVHVGPVRGTRGAENRHGVEARQPS